MCACVCVCVCVRVDTGGACNSSPCQNGGSCTSGYNANTYQQYTCTCPPHFGGYMCQIS